MGVIEEMFYFGYLYEFLGIFLSKKLVRWVGMLGKFRFNGNISVSSRWGILESENFSGLKGVI